MAVDHAHAAGRRVRRHRGRRPRQRAIGRSAFGTRADFVARYQGIAAEAGITAVKVTVTGAPDLNTAAPIKVDFTSDKVGAISEANTLQLRNENGAWKVDWTPSLIFKDLGTGCIN